MSPNKRVAEEAYKAVVKEILGHSDIKMTIRYAHPTPEGKMNAVKALERQMEDLDRRNMVAQAKLAFKQNVATC